MKIYHAWIAHHPPKRSMVSRPHKKNRFLASFVFHSLQFYLNVSIGWGRSKFGETFFAFGLCMFGFKNFDTVQ